MARPRKSWALSATITDGPESAEELLTKKALIATLKRALYQEDLILSNVTLLPLED